MSSTIPTTGDEDRPTVPLVRHEVRDLLLSSSAFKALPPDQQKQLAHDLVNVGQYLADAGGETFGVPLGAVVTDDAERTVRPLAEDDRDQTAGDLFADQGGAVAGAAGPGLLAGLVDSVNFPGFVAELIQGVFQAIVDASIQQMEAFADLVENVSKSVDAYMQDNVSENQARDYLAERYPDHLQIDIQQETPRVVPQDDADESALPDFFTDLGLDFPIDSLDDETTEEVLMPAARKQMAIDRQRMLLMMVMMGINRLVVTDGSIKAAVIFELDTTDTVTDVDIATESDTRKTKSNNRSGTFSGWFSPRWSDTSKSRLNVTTTKTTDSEATITTKAQLTGDVSVRFKSDVFPLKDISDLIGVQEPQLPTTQPRTDTGGDPAA